MPQLRRTRKPTSDFTKPIGKLEEAINDVTDALASCDKATGDMLASDWARTKAAQSQLEALTASVQALVAGH